MSSKDEPSKGEQEPRDCPAQDRPAPEGEEAKGRGCGFSIVGVLSILALLCVLAAIIVPNFIRARSRGSLTACKSNLKNMGTAMEMYSTDWDGKYPPLGKAQLTPNYLKTIPECPSAGTDTYLMTSGPSAPYNTQSYEDYYFIECHGENHLQVSVPKNYPQYNGIVGLIER